MLDWCSEAQALADEICNATHPSETHEEAWRLSPSCWRRIPRWLWWCIAADLAVFIGSALWAVVH